MNPRSMALLTGIAGNGVVSRLTTKLTYHEPSASRMMVQLDGVDGRSRDHLIFKSPILARYSLPLSRRRNPLAVNLALLTGLRLSERYRARRCRWVLRTPFQQARNASRCICSRGTLATSASHARSSVRFASASTFFCNAAEEGILPLGSNSFRNRHTVSFHTTLQQPNSRFSDCSCTAVGYARYRYRTVCSISPMIPFGL